MLASELRWILIGFGIVLLAGIYLWGRRRGGAVASEDAVVRVRPEPPLRRETPNISDVAGLTPDDDEATLADEVPPPRQSAAADPFMITAVRPATTSSAARIADPVDTDTPAAAPQDTWRGRLEPTFGDPTVTEELPVRAESPVAAPSASAPTLSSSETPQPRRIERRKILSLRLAVSPQRIEGVKLLEAVQAESLQHGKYDVFHRLHTDGTSIFSVASMVEPGTFDLQKMPQTQYPGVTLFAQLPGPVPGMHALNELVACARRMQQALGGTLQDDRGVPLTVHRIERLRQEVREFERPPSNAGRSNSATSPSV